MGKLFGVPMSDIALALGVLFAASVLFLLFVAVRNPVLVRMAVRNVPRRRAQSVLIITGLMLATVIISSAFTTGDSITFSINRTATESLRSLDDLVRVDKDSPVWRGKAVPDEFPQALFDQIGPALEADKDVDGVVPAVAKNVAVANAAGRQFEVNALLTGLDPVRAASFDRLTTTGGALVDLTALGPSEVYIDKDGADRLDVREGGRLAVAAGPGKIVELVVKGVADGAYFKRSETKVVLMMPLARAQELLDRRALLSGILVSNRGGYMDGERLSGAVKSRLGDLPAIKDNGLEFFTLKSDIVKDANKAASLFVTVFTTFGLFSIGVGVLLIFLIFTMLAAERKTEMGISRAVGMQRNHLVRMFVAEGAIYSLGAALVGALIGIGVGFVLVYGVSAAFSRASDSDTFTLSPHIALRSLLVSFFIGSLFTLVTVGLASWRVSRLNIVRAIRDIPEPQMARAGRRSLIWGIILTLVGLAMLRGGLASSRLAIFGLGASLAPVGLALALRYLGVAQHRVLTLLGLYLLGFWLLPESVFNHLKDNWHRDFSLFFISGSLVVTGGVLVTMNNSQAILNIVMRTLGRGRRLAPIAKSAVSYPLRSTFRTGLSVAMFAAVIFSIIVMASLNVSFDRLFDDRERLTGGYDVIAQSVTDLNPVTDLAAAVDADPSLSFVTRAGERPSVGTLRTIAEAKGRLAGKPEADDKDSFVSGVDDDFIASNRYAVKLATPEFRRPDGSFDSAAVWRTLRDRPGTAVVNATLVPRRNQFQFAGRGDRFHLDVDGLFLENKTMDPVPVTVTDLKSGKALDLTVIGVVDDVASLFFLPPAVFTSTHTFEQLLPRAVPPTRLFFHVKPGTPDAARRIEAAFFQNGMDAIDLKKTIDDTRSARTSLLDLLTGFMALGLVVGIAALGVITARAVVERRHHIGVLRAIGYSRRMVQSSFLLESSFIALIGIAIGIFTGIITSFNAVHDVRSNEPNLGLVIPWGRIAIIVAGAWLFSLVTTLPPSRHASTIAPADALRYE